MWVPHLTRAGGPHLLGSSKCGSVPGDSCKLGVPLCLRASVVSQSFPFRVPPGNEFSTNPLPIIDTLPHRRYDVFAKRGQAGRIIMPARGAFRVCAPLSPHSSTHLLLHPPSRSASISASPRKCQTRCQLARQARTRCQLAQRAPEPSPRREPGVAKKCLSRLMWRGSLTRVPRSKTRATPQVTCPFPRRNYILDKPEQKA